MGLSPTSALRALVASAKEQRGGSVPSDLNEHKLAESLFRVVGLATDDTQRVTVAELGDAACPACEGAAGRGEISMAHADGVLSPKHRAAAGRKANPPPERDWTGLWATAELPSAILVAEKTTANEASECGEVKYKAPSGHGKAGGKYDVQGQVVVSCRHLTIHATVPQKTPGEKYYHCCSSFRVAGRFSLTLHRSGRSPVHRPLQPPRPHYGRVGLLRRRMLHSSRVHEESFC